MLDSESKQDTDVHDHELGYDNDGHGTDVDAAAMRKLGVRQETKVRRTSLVSELSIDRRDSDDSAFSPFSASLRL